MKVQIAKLSQSDTSLDLASLKSNLSPDERQTARLSMRALRFSINSRCHAFAGSARMPDQFRFRSIKRELLSLCPSQAPTSTKNHDVLLQAAKRQKDPEKLEIGELKISGKARDLFFWNSFQQI